MPPVESDRQKSRTIWPSRSPLPCFRLPPALDGAAMKVPFLPISILGLTLVGGVTAQDSPAPATEQNQKDASAESAPRVAFETTMGKFVLELNEEKAPVTTKNFLSYVDDKFYDGTIFHRVIGDFVIQGGGFELQDGMGAQKETKPPIKNEAKNGLKNLRGTISMARTSNPNSATSQFFISVVDNPALDPNPRSPDGYAVFGKVVEGMEVVDKIKQVPTTTKKLKARYPNGQLVEQPMSNVPVEPVVVKTARRVEATGDGEPEPAAKEGDDAAGSGEN